MNNNVYSYDKSLLILDLCVGLETHQRLSPNEETTRLLGKNLVDKILEMRHSDRITMIKEIAKSL